MSRDIHYKDGHKWQKELMEIAAPLTKQNAKGTRKLINDIEILNIKEKEILEKLRKLKSELIKICKHPTNKRLFREWTTTDTLGNCNGTYEYVFCTICGEKLKSWRNTGSGYSELRVEIDN